MKMRRTTLAVLLGSALVSASVAVHARSDAARVLDAVAKAPRPGHVAIPLLFGIDAVHGNNNIVAGPAADDIGTQSGGWTLSWQGAGNTNADFPDAQSISAGIAAAMRAGGGCATLSVDGSFTRKPDAAIMVFGEPSYAKMRGDLRTLEFQPGDRRALALLRRLQTAGIPSVSASLSGRPMWVNPELSASDAFVAAWLPGGEGGGIADVLMGDATGRQQRDFSGRLSYSWPKTAGQVTLNHGAPGYDPPFPLEYAPSYARPGRGVRWSEVAGVDAGVANTGIFFTRGDAPPSSAFEAADGVARAPVDGLATQEGAIRLTWPAGRSAIGIRGPALDLTRETNADPVLQMTYRVDRAASGPVRLGSGAGALDATASFAAGDGWRTAKVTLKCLRERGATMAGVDRPWALTATGPFTVSPADLRLATDAEGAACLGPTR